MINNLQKIINILNNGGIIVFPTDTAYGIGCRMDDQKAVEKLFTLRKRPFTQATPVLVSSIKMAQKYFEPLTAEVINLMKKHWPGALTIVYPCIEDKIYSLVRGGGDTLGIRMPNNKTFLSIIEQLDCPILGPSANFHGEKTPFKFKEINQELLKMVDYIIEDDSQVKGGVSTVLDCSIKPYKIIRQGNINI